jgi:DNA-binding CsgD family transcriptional regulator
VLLAEGALSEAAARVASAYERAAQAGAEIEQPRCQALAGRISAKAGDRERAVAGLREAEASLDHAGAVRDASAARRELRKRGARSEPRGRAAASESGTSSLTRREREIAELVTARRTNREIAAELFLSQKTIETHLRNIFFKLGASSRVDAARAIERDPAFEAPTAP